MRFHMYSMGLSVSEELNTPLSLLIFTIGFGNCASVAVIALSIDVFTEHQYSELTLPSGLAQ